MKDYDFARAFARAAAKVFGKSDEYRVGYSQEMYVVNVNSVLLYDLILKGIDAIRPIIEKYPAPFIRGFFDGDGDAGTSVSKNRLAFCVRATNCNLQYLQLLDEVLRKHFGICGNIHVAHEGGYEGRFGRRRVIFRNRTYVLKIDGFKQVSRFTASIGFEIRRKQEKLNDAVRLVRDYGSKAAAQRWLQLYEKRDGRWKRRTVALS